MTHEVVIPATDSLQAYREWDSQVDAAEDEGVTARWHFGRALLEERKGKQLPHGRLDEVCIAIGKSRTEVGARMAFAAEYDTLDKVSNALETYGSWHAICDGLGKRVRKERESPEFPEGSPVPKLYSWSADDMDLPDDSIDLIITSPPYNLGSEHWPMGGDGATPRPEGIGYSDDLPEDDYQKWQLSVFAELYRVAKPGASFFYNHKVRQTEGTVIHPMSWLLNEPNWTLRQEIIWDRGSTHNHTSSLFWPHDERIYWLTKGKPNLERPINIETIWNIPGPQAFKSDHPAPFSDELPKTIIEAVSRNDPEFTILDPFGGSMTTCRVAQMYGYPSIGVDIDPDYIDLARRENGW